MIEPCFLFGYQDAQDIRLGFQKGSHLYALDAQAIPSFDWLMAHLPASDLIGTLEAASASPLPADMHTTLKGVVNRQPIWAAGVTYKTSEEARERESAGSTVYTRVYSAARPEIFWKAMAYEAVSSGDNVGIRSDARWSVPEPELTLVVNGQQELIGFTIANDMSSRDIEGENPLYLPQAKVYDDACSIGPRIWLQPNAQEWPQLDIHIEIEREGAVCFSGSTSTRKLHRSLTELVEYLLRCKTFSQGVFLMTGTGVVPSDDFTLQVADQIRIKIDPIGELVNQVHVVGKR